MKYSSLTDMGDQLLWFKYVVKNSARMAGKTATFMPKPLFDDNGSGKHCHQSIWKDGKPLFAGDQYAGHQRDGAPLHRWHPRPRAGDLRALATRPSTATAGSCPGFEAPVNLAYSSRNRSASIRIPMYSASPKAKRIEARFPDSSGNPYLVFACMLMAGLDGIQRKLDPGEPFDKDLYSLSPEELKGVPTVPSSLEGALDALESDMDFLLQGDVFTRDILDEWIAYKRENEVDPMRLRPTPLEFDLYYDV